MQILIFCTLTILTFLLLLVILMGIFYLIDLFLDLPYVGAKKEAITTIIKIAEIKKNQTVVDLGSGDGRLLFASAAKGAYAIGYELNPFLVLLSKIRLRIFHLRGGSRVSARGHLGGVLVKKQSFWKADLKVADVIFVYSLKKTITKFEEFVYKNAKPGTRVVVNLHPFPHKKPTKVENGIYLYKI